MNSLKVANEHEAYEQFLAHGWGDGLPIVAPTVERVDRFIAAWGRDPDEVLMVVPPVNAELTCRGLVVNAVMAGCTPDWLPYVEAAMMAMSEEQFNLYSVQTTTSPIAPLVLVNGPSAALLGLNCTTGAMGPGNRANSTIGRAVRLTMANVGDAQPFSNDRATSGLPTKFSWCVPENELDSPFEPFHCSLGFKKNDDVVTVVGAHGPITVVDPGDVPGVQILRAVTAAACTVGTNLWFRPGGQLSVFFSPDHAQLLKRDGIDRGGVQNFVHENARLPVKILRQSGYHELRNWPDSYDQMPADETIPLVASPNEVLVAVVGGSGVYSHVIPGHGVCGKSVSRVVRW